MLPWCTHLLASRLLAYFVRDPPLSEVKREVVADLFEIGFHFLQLLDGHGRFSNALFGEGNMPVCYKKLVAFIELCSIVNNVVSHS